MTVYPGGLALLVSRGNAPFSFQFFRKWRKVARDGVTVLARMLDREYVERTVTRVPTVDAALDPVSEVMISGLQAIGSLESTSLQLRSQIDALSQSDSSLRVREVALRTLEIIGPEAGEPNAALNQR